MAQCTGGIGSQRHSLEERSHITVCVPQVGAPDCNVSECVVRGTVCVNVCQSSISSILSNQKHLAAFSLPLSMMTAVAGVLFAVLLYEDCRR